MNLQFRIDFLSGAVSRFRYSLFSDFGGGKAAAEIRKRAQTGRSITAKVESSIITLNNTWYILSL